MEGKNEDSQHDQASSCVPCQVEGKFDHWGRIDVDAECCQVAIEIQTEALPKSRYDGRRRNRLADWTIEDQLAFDIGFALPRAVRGLRRALMEQLRQATNFFGTNFRNGHRVHVREVRSLTFRGDH